MFPIRRNANYWYNADKLVTVNRSTNTEILHVFQTTKKKKEEKKEKKRQVLKINKISPLISKNQSVKNKKKK